MFVQTCKKNYLQIRCRSQLTDEHFTSQLTVATMFVKADIDELRKDSNIEVSHENGLSIQNLKLYCLCLVIIVYSEKNNSSVGWVYL